MNSIINISEAASIAIHSMVYLARNENNPIKIKELADFLNSSETHLAKVMQILSKKNGLVISTRGRNGGFKLAKPATEINSDRMSVYEAGFFSDKLL